MVSRKVLQPEPMLTGEQILQKKIRRRERHVKENGFI